MKKDKFITVMAILDDKTQKIMESMAKFIVREMFWE